MSITTEQTFEANIEAHLLDHGWNKVDPSGYDKKLGLFPDELLAFVQQSQPKAWASLVSRHGGETSARIRFLEWVSKETDARGVLDVLRNQIKDSGVPVKLAYFAPASGLNDELRARYDANRLGIVRQMHHSESRPQDSLDVTLLVNGIPVATAELKNGFTGQSIDHAMEQYRTDRVPHDAIFTKRTLVHFAVDPRRVAMTTKVAGDATRFLPFNLGSNGPGHTGTAGNPHNPDGYDTAYLWEQVWQRDNWLDLLASFVHVSTDEETKERRVLFPRFHQWHAVRSIVDATLRDGAGVDRLIQHSAGSGKSNTIAWTAHKLARLHRDDRPVFDKVIVITDRKVLDRQLQETVAGVEHTPGTVVRVDKDSAQLKAALEGNAARIIITTLQKFPVVIEHAKKQLAETGELSEVAGSHFAVIVDEAHSSTGGTAVKDLKHVLVGEAALDAAERAQELAEEASEVDDALLASAAARGKQSNLSFFAFTATPKPKTLELFGEPDADGLRRPFHTYSMRQAIDEGFILDVLANYTTYAVYYKLANAEPDDPEVDAGKARAQLARFASLHPHNMAAKAEIIVEHFRAKTAERIDGRAKAMVVTRSRLHAMMTKKAIDDYIVRKHYDRGQRAIKTLVAFSGSLVDPSVPEKSWTEAELNGFPESQLPKKFREEYDVLVVAEKYQTGFDEPLLHTMYVDKKLAGVAAVQTLSRLNRTAPGKDDTFVLDFANSAEEIQEAFKPFFEVTLAQPTDPNILYTMSRRLMDAGVLSLDEMDAAVRLLLGGEASDAGHLNSIVELALGRWAALDDEASEAFKDALKHYVRTYAFVAQIMPWSDADLERLFLFGKLLLALILVGDRDPMPQVSPSVALTHLRLSVTHEGAIELEGDASPGRAVPGEGVGPQAEPVMDKLSALIAALNERYGAGLTDADRLLIEQHRDAALRDDQLREVAVNNDRANYDLFFANRFIQILVDVAAHSQGFRDTFLANVPAREALGSSLAAETYDTFRRGD